MYYSSMYYPAMADNGKMYPAFTDDFALEMKKLCLKADIIVPNLTEACKMTGIEYISGRKDSLSINGARKTGYPHEE